MPALEALFLLVCAAAAFRPVAGGRAAKVAEVGMTEFPGWTARPELVNARSLSLNPRDVHFTEQFPGKIAAFGDERCIWIARWIAQPTRKLHPSADCLRAAGYRVHPEPILADGDGTHWGVISASRDSEKLIVRERIVDRDGREFTDVSAWYWSAVFEKSTGPWWCLTKIESSPAS